ADMDVELADDRLARDFGLILAGDKGLVERAAAVRASVREDCLVNLIDGSRVGGQAMAVTAVSRTAFATGLLGLGLGRPLGEGSGLAFALAAQLIDLGASLGQFRLQTCVLLAKTVVLLTQLLDLLAKLFDEVAQVVELRQEVGGNGHRITDLDGCRQCHDRLTTRGCPLLLLCKTLADSVETLIKYLPALPENRTDWLVPGLPP